MVPRRDIMVQVLTHPVNAVLIYVYVCVRYNGMQCMSLERPIITCRLILCAGLLRNDSDGF